MTVVLRLEDVVVRSDSRVILDVPSFAVTEGEVVGVLGPNGAGKSTLLRVACLLWKPDQGRVILDGKPASERDLRRATAAVLQRPLLRRGSVQRNVETGLRFRGRSRREARRLAEPWMRKLGIAELRACPTRQLSGGEGQRVSLARALATAPRLLILDEPFAALDAPTRAELLADLRPLLAETGTSTLLATHDVREAAALADRVAILHAGKIRQIGPTAEVFAKPADDDCARIVSSSGLDLLASPRG
jgi:tungstate transport system ATP-binding protein